MNDPKEGSKGILRAQFVEHLVGKEDLPMYLELREPGTALSFLGLGASVVKPQCLQGRE